MMLLVLTIHQSKSVIHIHISPLVRLFPHVSHYRILNRLTCAIQLVFISYFICCIINFNNVV